MKPGVVSRAAGRGRPGFAAFVSGVVAVVLLLATPDVDAAETAPPPAVHWAFLPATRPPVPAVKDTRWPRNAIDRFVLARMEREHLVPARPATPAALLRRASFGTTGLPPTPVELSAFEARHDDATYTRTVGRMLASRAHGEHWARHWMDLARHADSAGYELDYLFTHSWRYRDWLVRSFESNKPMDRFIREQIAGDQLWPGDADAADGALFLTIGPMRFEGGIQRAKERENEWLTDLADTTGSVFLGVTMGCARCHDHKFDPFTQADYYGLQAVFADSAPKEERVGKGGGSGDTRPAYISLVPRNPPGVVRILRRGEVDLPGREALPSKPASLPDGGPLVTSASRRSEFAEWLVSRRNPLVARVLVNRAWQWMFGEGLVRTPSDFGRQGEAPSHPELLDWLACELIDSGWDLGHVQRLMLESSTYRQSSLVSTAIQAADPSHRWLAGFPRRRLAAEELRDALLAVSGELNPKSFGPPVVPVVEPWALAALRNRNWEPTPDAAESRRRAVYLVVRRSIKLPFLDAFNGPDTVSSCARRDRTVVPSQALALMNGADTLERSRALAGRLWTESGGNAEIAATRAWPLVFGRGITRVERARAVAFVRSRENEWSRAPVAPDAAPTNATAGVAIPAGRGAAWVEWCLALLNSNEFVYVD